MAKVLFVVLIAAVVLLQSEAMYLKPRALGFRPRPKPLMDPERLIALGRNYRRGMFADAQCVNQQDDYYCQTFAGFGYCENEALYYETSNLAIFAEEYCPETCGRC